MNFMTKMLIALAIIVAVIAMAVALAPYIIGAFILWLAWKLVVGPALNCPEDTSDHIIDVGPTPPSRR